jgi:MFS family permease
MHLELFGSQWRAIFLINVPIGIVAAVLAWFLLPSNSGEDRSLRIDLAGVTLLTLASLLLIVPLVEGHEYGWPAWTFAMMAVAECCKQCASNSNSSSLFIVAFSSNSFCSSSTCATCRSGGSFPYARCMSISSAWKSGFD